MLLGRMFGHTIICLRGGAFIIQAEPVQKAVKFRSDQKSKYTQKNNAAENGVKSGENLGRVER